MRDIAHSDALHQAGATGTVTEFLEASLELGKAALLDAGVAEDGIGDLVESLRQNDYALLKEMLSQARAKK